MIKVSGFQVFTKIRSFLLMAMLLFFSLPSVVSAIYPPAPTQFADLTAQIRVASDEHGHAMVAYQAFLSDPAGHINTYYFSDNVWNFLPLNSSIGSVTGLAMDPSGLALLTYREDSSGDLRSFYFDGTMWIAPSNNPLETGIPSGGSLAINDSGLGVTAWADSSNDIRISFFSNNNWGSPSAPGAIGTGFSPDVAINANGDVVVAWRDLSGAAVARHYIGGVWSGVSTTLNPNAFIGGVGISDNGKSLVLFTESGTSDIFSSYFTGGVFNSTTLLNPPQPFGPANFNASLEMAPNGTAVAAWQYNQTFFNQYDLYYAQFNGNTWAPAVDFQTGINGAAATFSLNSNGDALFFWGNDYNSPDLVEYFIAQLPVGGVLTTPQLIRTSSATRPDSTSVSLADSGFSALAWSEFNSIDDASTPFGLAAVLAPAPTGFTARVCTNRFATQSDRVNILTWQPSSDPNVVSYILERNGIVIANIPASSPLTYEDHNRCKARDVYTLIPVDIDGVQGIPATLAVFN